jgi:hypothetical protein
MEVSLNRDKEKDLKPTRGMNMLIVSCGKKLKKGCPKTQVSGTTTSIYRITLKTSSIILTIIVVPDPFLDSPFL